MSNTKSDQRTKDAMLWRGLVGAWSPEMLRNEETLAELRAAICRSGLDITTCRLCGLPVVAIPDGLAACEPCATKEADEQSADDDKPITAEWLSTLTTTQKDAHLTGRFIWVIAAEQFCAFIVTFEPQERRFVLQANGQALSVVQTRGDVRGLCAALGVPLEET